MTKRKHGREPICSVTKLGCLKGSDNEKIITNDLIYVKNEKMEATHGFLNSYEQLKGKRLCIYAALIIGNKDNLVFH